MGFIGGLLIGLFIGTFIGVFVTALCVIAKEGEDDGRSEMWHL